MALPDYFKRGMGTPVIWGQASGSGVTNTLSFNNLADGVARMGAYADLGELFSREYAVILTVETGTAPTAGLTADLYFACSPTTSLWPAGITGSDGDWPADGNEDEWIQQLGRPPFMQFVSTDDANTAQIQFSQRPLVPTGRYVVPVFHNQLGQAVRNQGTPADNASRIYLYPLVDSIQDT